MEYKILHAWDSTGLQEQVNEHLLSGWKPQGGIAVLTGMIYQAMIREK